MNNFFAKLPAPYMIMIGLLSLCISGGLYFYDHSPSISVADQENCVQYWQEKYNNSAAVELLNGCKNSVGMIAQIKAEQGGAKTAQEFALAISQANNASTAPHIILMAFIGLFLAIGMILFIAGVGKLSKRTR